MAAGVHVRRCRVLDVNSVLVVGRERSLLVDTLSTGEQGRELAAAVRRVTDTAIVVANTHPHFDHCFGNRAIAEDLGVAEFWAHRDVAAALADADGARSEAREVCRLLAPEIADAVATTPLLPPNREVTDAVDLDLGGRAVRLWHPGPAHTRGDLVVFADQVTIAGDLVEESGPPGIGRDSDAANWPRVLDALLDRVDGPVVPGHGAVVDAGFVARQRDELAAALG